MTLIVGLQGKHELVFASDTLGWDGVKEGYYKFRASKLRLIGRDWISGTAGTGVGADLQSQIAAEADLYHEDIDVGAPAYAVRTLELYRRSQYAGQTSFLLGGYHHDAPVIYRWSLPHFTGPIRCSAARAAIGIGEHGAMHFAAAYHQETMSTEQRMFLAYFCIYEVAQHDPRVGTPIEMVVARRGGVTVCGENELARFRRESESLTGYIASRFSTLLVERDPLFTL